jgi:DNA-binding transcriptional LysR family regulator
MIELRGMEVFATVIEKGSMSGAARALGMSTSAISQQVRELERRGGVTLLHRSTRKLALTEAGAHFLEDCAAMLAAARRARQQLLHAREAPVGQLRLSAPVGFARHVAPALGELLAAHPALTLRLLVDDARIDLIDARIDLALRFGRLPDSTWVARRLCGLQTMLCAAPSWLAAHGAPQRPDDLPAHQWLTIAPDDDAHLALSLTDAHRQSRELRIAARISSNNQLSIQQMCADGLGLARLGTIDVHDDLASGRLVPVLPGWALPSLDVWAVTPQRDAQPAKVRHAIDALQRYLVKQPGVLP